MHDAAGDDRDTVLRTARSTSSMPMAWIDGVTDLVASRIVLPPEAWGWRRRLSSVLFGLRAACLEHPEAATLLQQTRVLTPALLAPVEIALRGLDDAGLHTPAARSARAALLGLTYGHVAHQPAGHMSGPAPGVRTVDAAAFPHVATMATGPAFNWDLAFGRALDAVIDGFTAGAARHRRGGPGGL